MTNEIDRGVALAHEAQALLCNMLRVSAAVEIEETLHILDDIILIFHNTGKFCDPPSDE